jgi:steroid delta-isomerase
MTSENVPAVVARYFSAIGEMDPDAWAACFAQQGTSYEPGSPTPLQGRTALRQFLAEVLGAFEKITMTQDHVFQSGNRVAVKFTGRGTGKNGRASPLRRHRCVRDQPGKNNRNYVGLLEPSRDDGATAGVKGVCTLDAITAAISNPSRLRGANAQRLRSSLNAAKQSRKVCEAL